MILEDYHAYMNKWTQVLDEILRLILEPSGVSRIM